METLGNLESFVRAAEASSFSEAARRMGISAAAVSKNVARLEANLGTRLFQRSTRSLTLTEAGELFYQQVSGSVETIQGAIAQIGDAREVPAGRLRVNLSPSFAYDYVLPLLKSFKQRYPEVVPDWHLEIRRVDLIGEGFDVAIGGGIELSSGIVARELAKLHLVAVAAPQWLEGRTMPVVPGDLQGVDGIVMRSTSTGRLLNWTLRDAGEGRFDVNLKPTAIMNDPEALCSCALMGLGVGLVPMERAWPWLQRGDLVRLLPDWYVDLGVVSVYFSSRKALPAKTRVFVDFLLEHFQGSLSQRFRAD
ncbi:MULTISPECIES: LysR family transcriptional regulator [unclassified Pseudomonas]|uniref:LysR family transcriptional regulator n=1 Tax=unclassified Pseudomonas TaxID=196821 RepID=UPI000C868C94|nr:MULTISPECIES: LysR family transcriptional regulator [unclassified Pseudomonas]MDO8404367.1 LysR family transcriptional regulator [Pseudomonas sp.]PMV89447.1 LysR family transcriptional regulator [Pseudomonas sp. GW101-1A09]PMV99410.1 LysR family transcriptional regulator [Pseudomonas sp. FW306-2-2C-B10A]PMW00762.1 LysR family transcriptional regulator [Pseudomonas sp. GW460-C8]PMW03200.1 LysR family transcriptional regulator [Pseudomonas sp. MPR-TSA4]